MSKRWGTAFVLLCFLLQSFVPPVPAALSPEFSTKVPRELSPKNVSELKIPARLGRIEELSLEGQKPFAVILQGAHANPEAQKNIRKTIQWLQRHYGIQYVGIEGAPEKIDTEFLETYPDGKALKHLFREYEDKGELPGGLGAAIFSPRASRYFGLEDSELYQEGYEIYRKATASSQSALLESTENKLRALSEKKQKAFDPRLLNLQNLLNDFDKNPAHFLEALKALSAIKPPSGGSNLALLSAKLLKGDDNPVIHAELAALSQKIEEYLQGKNSKQTRKAKALEREFISQVQAFQTSQILDAEYAVWSLDFLKRIKYQPDISRGLSAYAKNHAAFTSIRSSSFWNEFQSYSEEIQKSLLRNQDEKKLFEAEHELRLALKFIKLEITENQWTQIRERASFQTPDFAIYRKFYENAVKRDDQFWNAWQRVVKFQAPSAFIVGGFHSRSLSQKLKKSGIPYAVITPVIHAGAAQGNYKRQMRGQYSWNNKSEEFQPGMNYSFYDLFIEAVRDKLLESKQVSPEEWHEALIRDLAQKNRIMDLPQYSKHLEGVLLKRAVNNRDQEMILKEWHENIDQFFQSGNLKEEGSRDSAEFLRPAFETPGALIFSPGVKLRVPAVAVPRSELRNIEALSPDQLLKELKAYRTMERSTRALESDLAKDLKAVVAEGDLKKFSEFIYRLKNTFREKEDMPGIVNVMLFEVTKDESALRQKISDYWVTLSGLISRSDPEEEALKTIRWIGVGDIVVASPESVHAASGGMASVIRELYPTLVKSGLSIIEVTLLYRDEQTGKADETGKHPDFDATIAKFGLKRQKAFNFPINFGGTKWSGTDQYFPGSAKSVTPDVYVSQQGDLRRVFLYHQDYTPMLYPKDQSGKFYLELAIFLSRGTLEYARYAGIAPSIIISNDWMTNFIPLYMRVDPYDTSYRNDPYLRYALTLDTIHNAGPDYPAKLYTNQWAIDLFTILNIPGMHYGGISDRFDSSHMNLVRAAITHSSAILTVSPRYLEENLEPGPNGLAEDLKARETQFYGISNGLLESVWLNDYDTMGREAAGMPKFSGDEKNRKSEYIKNLPVYKAAKKKEVQRIYSKPNQGVPDADKRAYFGSLADNPSKPLVVMVARLAEQKGIELLTEGIKKVLDQSDAQIFLGGVVPPTGPEKPEVAFKKAMIELSNDPQYAGRFVFRPEFTPNKESFLGADIFLMPSKDEPGGIAQLEALLAGDAVAFRFGGGPANTVTEFDAATKSGDGFHFVDFTTDAFVEATLRGIQAISDEGNREAIILNAASTDNSWDIRLPLYQVMMQNIGGVVDAQYPHLADAQETLKKIQPHLNRAEFRSEMVPVPVSLSNKSNSENAELNLALLAAPKPIAISLRRSGLVALPGSISDALRNSGADSRELASRVHGAGNWIMENIPVDTLKSARRKVLADKKQALLKTLSEIKNKNITLGIYDANLADYKIRENLLVEAYAAVPDLKVTELVYNKEASRDFIRHLLDKFKAQPHPHDLNEAFEIKNSQNGVVLLVSANKIEESISNFFWPVLIDHLDETDTETHEYTEFLKAVAALHMTDILSGETRKWTPDLLKAELLRRLNLDAQYQQAMNFQGQQLIVSASAASLYLQAQAEILLQKSA